VIEGFQVRAVRLFSTRRVAKQARSIATILVAACAAFGALLTGAAAHASDVEARARILAERLFPGKKVEAFRKLPELPFYELWINRYLLYTDLDAKVLITGDMLRASDLSSMREMRIGELERIAQKDIPLETAVKTVQGKGGNKIVVFADPNCGYCKQFETQLKTLDNVTIYTVLYPVLGPDSIAKSRNILCAANPSAAWRAWMESGVEPPAAAEQCKPNFDKVTAFGREHHIAITPTTVYADSHRQPGTMPAMTINTLIGKANRVAAGK
jgi:thiol:disulfide interchange protein DsbC